MKTKTVALLIYSFLVLTVASCKKEGLGGKGEIRGYTVYNANKVDHAIVYIKYGAKNSPGTDLGKYDANKEADGDGKFTFQDLKPGDYFLHAVRTKDGQTLIGETHVEINDGEIKENVAVVMNP
jgi:hypothetical protein